MDVPPGVPSVVFWFWKAPHVPPTRHQFWPAGRARSLMASRTIVTPTLSVAVPLNVTGPFGMTWPAVGAVITGVGAVVSGVPADTLNSRAGLGAGVMFVAASNASPCTR